MGAPIDLDGTSSATPDDPVVELRGGTETRALTLRSSDESVAFVTVAYVRDVAPDGVPSTPWRVDHAAIHHRDGRPHALRYETVMTFYSPDGDTAGTGVQWLADGPAWLTRTIVERWPASDADRCADEGCEHARYAHTGQGGRCVEGRMKSSAAWRCQCAGFVEPERVPCPPTPGWPS